MGYRIEYDGGVAVKKTMRASVSGRKRILIWVVSALITSFLLWPTGRRCVRDLLLPGDEDVTAAALGGLVENLSDGESVGEALEAFCREIIVGGE